MEANLNSSLIVRARTQVQGFREMVSGSTLVLTGREKRRFGKCRLRVAWRCRSAECQGAFLTNHQMGRLFTTWRGQSLTVSFGRSQSKMGKRRKFFHRYMLRILQSQPAEFFSFPVLMLWDA